MACTLPVTGSRLEIQVVPASLYTNFEYHLQVITISLLPVRLLLVLPVVVLELVLTYYDDTSIARLD